MLFLIFQLRCCGVTDKDDWQGILPGSNIHTNEVILPNSCFRYIGNENDTISEPFEDGCFDRMFFVVSQSAMLVATGAITVAFVQVSDPFTGSYEFSNH